MCVRACACVYVRGNEAPMAEIRRTRHWYLSIVFHCLTARGHAYGAWFLAAVSPRYTLSPFGVGWLADLTNSPEVEEQSAQQAAGVLDWVFLIGELSADRPASRQRVCVRVGVRWRV